MEVDVRSTMEKLELLDLSRCQTVSDVVAGMSRCSFGARMLGEVAETLTTWAQEREKPLIIYDGKCDTALGRLLDSMVLEGWFTGVMTPQEYAEFDALRRYQHLVVVGGFSERFADILSERPERAVYINPWGMAKPGQIRDGYFPDAVFADPRFVMPLIHCILEERLGGARRSASQFLEDIGVYGGLSAEVVQGAKTLHAMVQDPDCTVFLTLAGAMTVAQFGLIVCDMIDRGDVQAVTSTGALMAHGLVQGLGLSHYKYNPEDSDELLAARKLNRVTDTLEPERNFTHIADALDIVLNGFDGSAPIPTWKFHEAIGKHLSERYPRERAILKSAYAMGVPVFVPAFVDSELGNDVFVHNKRREMDGRPRLTIDPALDSDRLIELFTTSKKIAIFSIGGGTSRNNVQNGAPLIEITNDRLGSSLPERMFSYGCRIAPDAMWTGNLGGCTYSENMSWRKMDPKGMFAEVHTDATLVWPFLVKYVMEQRRQSA